MALKALIRLMNVLLVSGRPSADGCPVFRLSPNRAGKKLPDLETGSGIHFAKRNAETQKEPVLVRKADRNFSNGKKLEV